MYKRILQLFLFSFLINNHSLYAQADKRWIKHQVLALCAGNMEGRGYVKNGRDKAARLIAKKYAELGLKGIKNDSDYYQTYYFPVNTFPDKVDITINKKALTPGVDYIIDAGSVSFNSDKAKIKRVNLDKVKDSLQWQKVRGTWAPDEVHYLINTDSFCKRININPRHLAAQLPKGCYIIPQHGKLTWTVETDTIRATVFYMEDTVLPKHLKKATVAVHNLFLPSAKSENIIGYVPGEVKDSFIVFSAHYDHLGMMGQHAMFPGASDNASGTALMLYLASYFAKYPQHYSIAFIAFSGEEAGLLGSRYYTQHPVFPLSHIRFLTNLDIMGDATDGVTVVNATEYPKEFSLLQMLNTKGDYLPAIKSRGKAAISDHYFFSEAGVPCFFMYSNSGKGFYHDVFDVPKELTLNNIDNAAKLLIEFTQRLQR